MERGTIRREGYESKRSIGADEELSFDVKHLKTYTTGPEDPLPDFTDAIQLLSRQKNPQAHDYRFVIRRVSGQNVISLLDYWIGEQEAEQISISLITDVQSRSEGVQPEFDNLLLFRVEPSHSASPTNELHIFKVLRVPAEDVAAALVRAGARKCYVAERGTVAGTYGRNQPKSAGALQSTATYLPPSYPSTSRRSVQASAAPYRRTSGFDFREYSESEFSSSFPAYPEEINIDWIKAEVALLNHLFDEIEENLHIMRTRPDTQIRRTAETATVSKASVKSWSKATRKGSISKQPQAVDQEYEATVKDFFQKAKFVCILLSRISDYVKEPKAPVLICHVFSLIREGFRLCNVPGQIGPNPAQMIHQPRLPRETLNFMNTYLTGAQRTFLTELGSAWTIPREDTNDAEVYVPKFRKKFVIKVSDYEPSLFRYRELGADFNPERRYVRRVELDAFAEQLMDERRHIAKAVLNFKAKNDREISVNVGEYLELIDATRDWFKVRNRHNQIGYCPNAVLRVIERKDSIGQRPPVAYAFPPRY